ncbi:MAG TPA: CheR family methyltransferase [Polyangiaceae bacterium]|jgi:chemotaxis protein methyltransferase CheR
MSDSKSTRDIEIRLLLEAIYLRYHYDFRNYSMTSLERRLAMAMDRTQCCTVSDLQGKLLHEPATFSKVLEALTVQVSDLFRDPPFFRYFRERIVPELRTYPSVRLWVAGCSSGEEVYSFAILLREEGLLDRTTIYATDISAEALSQAESGVYPLERVAAFTENYVQAGGKGALSAHYTAAYGRAIFDRSLRSNVLLSDHSLATDSVFAEVQVVSCRNVLIYFDSDLKNRAVGLFRDALARRGFLGLGSNETLEFTSESEWFEQIHGEGTWYQQR